jgi:hypothetical protein
VSSTPIEVADWSKEAKSFRPRMTADVAAPADAALELVARALEAQGFRIKDRTAAGFRASYRDLVGGVLGVVTASDFDIVNSTQLSVAATPADDQRTVLTISVLKGGVDRAGRRRGREALTAAFQEAQRRGVAVTTTPWQRS